MSLPSWIPRFRSSTSRRPRGLGLEEHCFDQAFEQGLSTLRLIRYPVRTDLQFAAGTDPGVWVAHDGARCYITGAPHVDSGFLTLLAYGDYLWSTTKFVEFHGMELLRSPTRR